MVLDERALENMLARQRASEQSHVPRESVRTEQTEEFEVYERAGSSEPAQAPPAPLRAPPQPAAHPPEGHQPSPVPPSAPPQEPTALRPEPAQVADDFEELPGRQAPTEFVPPVPFRDEHPPAPMPNQAPVQPPTRQAPPAPPAAPEPAQAPEPQPTPASQPPAQPAAEPAAPQPAPAPQPTQPAPEPQPVPEPQPTPEPQPEPTPPTETRKPRVWPPISARADAPEPAPTAPEPTPAEPTPAEPTPAQPPAEPAPAPRTHAPTPHAFPEKGVDGTGRRIAVVQAKFNAELTDEMARQAVAHAQQTGATVSHHVTVPGVYDLPLTVQQLARRKDVDGIVVIGVVVQGETKHDELITFATAKTLQEVSLATDTPIGLGITGPGMTWEQAEARVGNGAHAVEAVLAQLQGQRTH